MKRETQMSVLSAWLALVAALLFTSALADAEPATPAEPAYAVTEARMATRMLWEEHMLMFADTPTDGIATPFPARFRK